MTTQAPVRTEQRPAPAQVAEFAAWSTPGIKVLVAGIVGVVAAIVLLLDARGRAHATATSLDWAGAILLIAAVLLLAGLTPVVPGQARVIQLFGKYRGTTRDTGLQWVNPFTRRIKVSTRIRNHETAQAKAVDAVDDYTQFVAIQTETAVRHIASSYPYTSQKEGDLSLRENVAEITGQLSTEIADRVRPAGVDIIESRLTRLSYAAEIAQAMLRQQQASAVVGARFRIVEGAVGMVQLALKRLEEEGVVELDEERKAAMVSNLLVVLCSEQATQQVVNTGSLYQ